MQRTKPTLMYISTKKLRIGAVLLRYIKLESAVRYLGNEVDDALEMLENKGV
jgi:hypothetical protein